MCDLVVGEDDVTKQIDWERLLNDKSLEFDDLNFFDDMNFCDGSAEQLSNPSPDTPVSLNEIEKFLLNDDGIVRVDDVAGPNHEVGNCLFLDILLDSPVESDGSRGEVVDLSDGGQKSSSPEVENNNNATGDGEEDDVVSKKRKRQERNRDAALRSRERKKMYVKDLEVKSRYFEGECKRLGMLLNCVIAENQALRISLNSSKAFDASMTKQESAVLLLESLLLGSLLWFLGTMCLLLPEPLQSTKVEVQLKNADNQNRGSLAPRKKAGSKVFELWVFQSMMGKRCKASRSRMKPRSLTPEVLA